MSMQGLQTLIGDAKLRLFKLPNVAYSKVFAIMFFKTRIKLGSRWLVVKVKDAAVNEDDFAQGDVCGRSVCTSNGRDNGRQMGQARIKDAQNGAKIQEKMQCVANSVKGTILYPFG